MILLICILLLIAFPYFTFIICFTVGWMKPGGSGNSTGLTTRISLLIPARNEEENILNCLDDIVKQDYPTHLLEVIIADDHSTDKTALMVSEFIRSHPDIPFRLLQDPGADPFRANKKQLIEFAIAHSTGDLIITTDADIHAEASWISSLAAYYETNRPKMILGPVSFHHEKSLFSKVQSLEFLGLMGVTGGSCRIGRPLMCNGANLAYERTAFNSVGGFKDNLGYSSGDDVFLMLKIKNHFGAASVRFLKSAEAIVRTEAKISFHDFIQQRLRWVSKNKGLKDGFLLVVAVITWLFNASLLVAIIGGFYQSPFFCLALILFLLKLGVEFPLLLMTSRWFGKTKFLVYYPFAQVLNIFYVAVIGFLGNFLPYKWKGRKG
jgi:cellulose synthase/poly-beta-1,6-N-acetylglucosamine synthase-like glycosyltransferase